MILISIVNFEKLLLKIECEFENECHSWIFLQLIEIFGK